MQYNVIKAAKKNIFWGISNKIIFILCPFISSTVIRYYLGVEYLGLDSLFASVISVLGLTELGLSSAIVSHLYKPVAENDTDLVNAILNFYRKAYQIIGLVMMTAGLCLIPFLPSLINGYYPVDITLWKVYLVFLLNTVISYFMYAYMIPLVTVYQREDLKSNINSIITIVMTAVKLFFLFLTRNYYFYILTMPLFTILSNMWTAYLVRKNYPQYSCGGSLPEGLSASLKKLATGTFIQKACALTRNSLDSICISTFLGLEMTARYTNYYLISAAVSSFTLVVATSFGGGVGNHVATRSPDENFNEFQKLDFIYLWLGGWCTICLFCLYQPFIRLWMGGEMLLGSSSVGLLCLYFYLLMLGDIRTLYSTAKGLWWEQRWRSLSETMLNIILNVSLGRLFGVNGIILATIISLFLCNCLWSAKIIFDLYFGEEKIFVHFRHQASYSLVTLFAILITYLVCKSFTSGTVIAELLVRAIICLTVPNVFYFLIYRRTAIFKESIRLVLRKEK